jgi:hypothetical protein
MKRYRVLLRRTMATQELGTPRFRGHYVLAENASSAIFRAGLREPEYRALGVELSD